MEKILLALLTALLCTVGSPIFARAPIDSAVPNRPSSPIETQSLVQQGKTLYDTGQFAEAVKVLQQAVQIYQAQGDSLRQAVVLSNLSLADQQLGLWSEATKAITDGLNLLQSGQKIDNSVDHLIVLAQILNTQGRLQWALGKPEQALTTWKQAQDTYTQAGDTTGSSLSLINQAQALQALGLYRRALETLTQVSQTLQKQPDSPIKTTGLHYLGNALRVVGELEKSRQVLQQSLAMAQQLQLPQEIGAALLSLGNVARLQQDNQAALAFYQQAATTFLSPTNKLQAQLNQLNLLLETINESCSSVISTNESCPSLILRVGDRRNRKAWSDAQALWSQIQSQITNLPPSHYGIYARIDFAQSLMKLGSWGVGELESTFKKGDLFHLCPSAPPSLCTSAQLLATAVQQAKSIEDQRAEAYALGSLGKLYEQTQQWLIAQDLTQQALLKAQAINASDITYRWQWQLGRLLKAQGDIKGAITDYTEAVSTIHSLRSDLVAINPDVQFSFRESVEPIYRQLVGLLLQNEGTYGPSQPNLAQALMVIESLQLAELENFFRAACLSAQPVLIDKVVDKYDPTAALIYSIILPERLEIILKLPQQQNLRHYATSIPQSQVESTVEQLRQNLEKPYLAPEGKFLSQQVYNWLLRAAETDLARSRIETLVFVLDGCLRNIPMAALYNGKQYLVEKYSIALTPSLQLLSPKPLKQVQLKTLIAGLTEARQGFSPLANVALELNQIKAEVPSVVLLNQQFTSTALQNQINSLPFPVVHLATHGQFSSNPNETFIVAWDKSIKINELSQLLQLRDQGESNAIELLVLSACQTASGDKRAALGLAGVAIRSGVRSTLASVWQQDDESGALLLGQFYHELATTRVTKAEALRRAQLALLKNPAYRYPRFWAPYVLVGNWL